MFTTRQRPGQRSHESGFTLIELMLVVIVVGIMSAVAVPAFRDQQYSNLESTVVSDMGTYTTAAERLYTGTFSYPVAVEGFDLRDRGNPFFSAGNSFVAFTVEKGADAGVVIYGRNASTEVVFVVSSWAGGGRASETTLTVLPTAPPVVTVGDPDGLNLPADVMSGSWSDVAGFRFGAESPAPTP